MHKQAQRVPACILAASEMDIASLGQLKDELVNLRRSLQKAV